MGFVRQWWRGRNFFLYLFLLLVVRKSYIAINIMHQVQAYRHQVSQEALESSDAFQQLIVELRSRQKPPALLFLNQHALNMTNNFLCNTAEYDNVHERFVFVTLDATARDSMRSAWPNIAQFYWPTPCLAKPFNFGDGLYQTIYLLRANLATLIAKRGVSFWMMQQDTFWRNDFFGLNLDRLDDSVDILFDQLGDSHPKSKRTEWINGANFFVKANQKTVEFFNATANLLERHYFPDIGIMIMQCHTWGRDAANCSFMPHRIAHSWEWLFTDQRNPPTIMQMDAETNAGGKLNELNKLGFYFLNEDKKTCNSSAVDMARHRMGAGEIRVTRNSMSWGRAQFIAYWYITDCLLSLPVLGPLMKPYFSMFGFLMMITL